MKKAFLGYPIRTPGGCYFYDTNRNSFVSISPSLFVVLQSAEYEETLLNANGEIAEEMNLLKSDGYLSSNRVEIIEYPLIDFVESFLENKVRKITLQITQNCNFRCSYCVYSDLNNESQRSHSDSVMSFDVAKRAVDFLLAHSRDCKTVDIGFYGGEPLLEYDLMRQVVEYAESVFEGKELTFSFTSNGSLLNEEIADYCLKHNIRPMISIDGSKKIHDINRRFAANGHGTFDTVTGNLKRLRESHRKFTDGLSISMVIDPQNDYDTISSFYDEDIFHHMPLRSTIIDDVYSLEKVVYSDEFIEKQNYQIFLAFLSHFERIDEKYVSPVAREYVSNILDKKSRFTPAYKLPYRTAPGGPCLAGRTRLFVDVAGNFYPCERVSETSCVMQIGNIATGFDIEAIKRLVNIGSLTADECRDCWVFTQCNLCAKHADNGTELSGALKLTNCNKVKQVIIIQFAYMLLLDEFKK